MGITAMEKYKKAYIEINDDIISKTITMMFIINDNRIIIRNVVFKNIPLDITLEYTYKKLLDEVIKYLEITPAK